MSTEAIEERLAGVPVYALSNAAEEFVLVSGTTSGKNIGLFCFKKEDAEALLEQVKSIDPEMRSGSKVVPVALNKVGTRCCAFVVRNFVCFACLKRQSKWLCLYAGLSAQGKWSSLQIDTGVCSSKECSESEWFITSSF